MDLNWIAREKRTQSQDSSLVLCSMPPCSHIRLFSCETLWSWRTTAGFARRRSESDCFQKQLWGDTLKLFKTCAWIFKCRQNLHQNAVGHPIACRTQAWLADFTSLQTPVKSPCGISSGLQELLAAKGIFQRDLPWSPATLTIHAHVKTRHWMLADLLGFP